MSFNLVVNNCFCLAVKISSCFVIQRFVSWLFGVRFKLVVTPVFMCPILVFRLFFIYTDSFFLVTNKKHRFSCRRTADFWCLHKLLTRWCWIPKVHLSFTNLRSAFQQHLISQLTVAICCLLTRPQDSVPLRSFQIHVHRGPQNITISVRLMRNYPTNKAGALVIHTVVFLTTRQVMNLRLLGQQNSVSLQVLLVLSGCHQPALQHFVELYILILPSVPSSLHIFIHWGDDYLSKPLVVPFELPLQCHGKPPVQISNFSLKYLFLRVHLIVYAVKF